MATIPAAPEVGASLALSRAFPPEAPRVPNDASKAEASEADLRLVIEEDPATGAYVYKTIDRRTGEVVSQLPREEVLKKRAEDEYAAGDVIRASA